MSASCFARRRNFRSSRWHCTDCHNNNYYILPIMMILIIIIIILYSVGYKTATPSPLAPKGFFRPVDRVRVILCHYMRLSPIGTIPSHPVCTLCDLLYYYYIHRTRVIALCIWLSYNSDINTSTRPQKVHYYYIILIVWSIAPRFKMYNIG